MFRFRILFFRLLIPIYRPIIFVTLRLMAGSPFRMGNCRIYGPSDFHSRCKNALNELKSFDPILCQRFVDGPCCSFWFHKTAVIDDRFIRFHTIPEAYLAWGTRGIMVRFVYAAFMQEMLGRQVPRSRRELYLKHDALRIRTQEWLKSHQFPDELLEPFNSSALDEIRSARRI